MGFWDNFKPVPCTGRGLDFLLGLDVLGLGLM